MWGGIIASLIGALVGGVTNAVATANAIDKKIKGYKEAAKEVREAARQHQMDRLQKSVLLQRAHRSQEPCNSRSGLKPHKGKGIRTAPQGNEHGRHLRVLVQKRASRRLRLLLRSQRLPAAVLAG